MRCPTLVDLPPPPAGKTGWPWTQESTQLPPTMLDGMEWPRLSIVTPSFNQGHFLEETIRSVLLQGYPNLEYIIIDGGSTDNSLDIIQRYQKWIASWVSEADNGQAHAINKGWAVSTGEFISWLNSDDFFMPEWANGVVSALKTQPVVSLVCVSLLVVDARTLPLRLLRGSSLTLETIIQRWQNQLTQPGFLMRRELLDRFGLLDEQFHFAMDFDYWMRLLTSGIKVKLIDEVLAGFRLHEQSKSSNLHRLEAEEFARIMDKYSSGFPPGLRSVAREHIARVYWNAAVDALLWQSDARERRRWVVGYLRNRGILGFPRVCAYLILSLLGNLGRGSVAVYRRLRGAALTPDGGSDRSHLNG